MVMAVDDVLGGLMKLFGSLIDTHEIASSILGYYIILKVVEMTNPLDGDQTLFF